MYLAFSFRQLFAFGALLCLSILGSAYLLEYAKELNPCPLCLLQRYMLWLLMFVFVCGAIWPYRRKLRLLFSSLILIGSVLGILLAGRQVWLQSLPPDQIPPCTAGLERLLTFHSIPKALQIVISSSGECGVVDYQIFGFSLAIWSLSVFTLLIFYGGILFYLEKKRRK